MDGLLISPPRTNNFKILKYEKNIFTIMFFRNRISILLFVSVYRIKQLGVVTFSNFFSDANSNFASAMLSADLSVAALSFFIFIIY